MAKRGRPIKLDKRTDSSSRKLPKKETEEHRQMRAYYLSLPPTQRKFEVVAQRFNCGWQKVYNASIAFNWAEDAQARDNTIFDPFVEAHRPFIEGFRINALLVACTHLENEMLRAGVQDAKIPSTVSKMLEGGDLDGAQKELGNFIKGLPMKAKDYKDLVNLVDLVRKIVFEWNPNQMNQKVLSMPISGGKNLIMVNNPYAPKNTEQAIELQSAESA